MDMFYKFWEVIQDPFKKQSKKNRLWESLREKLPDAWTTRDFRVPDFEF